MPEDDDHLLSSNELFYCKRDCLLFSFMKSASMESVRLVVHKQARKADFHSRYFILLFFSTRPLNVMVQVAEA